MNSRTVCCECWFRPPTPEGLEYKIIDRWSVFEHRACMSPSASAEEAYRKFTLNGEKIIESSFEELGNLRKIVFFEAVYIGRRYPVRKNDTDPILRENLG